MRDAAQAAFEADVRTRLEQLRASARMWGSPEELEAVAQHFTHVLLASQRPAWSFDQTHALWRLWGAPFAGDAEEHALMRTRMYADKECDARTQVVLGFASVWAGLLRHPEREARVGPWLEALLDEPLKVGKPDLLNIVLFALMGFVAADAPAYVRRLSAVRDRVGGHELRPLHVVAARGPTEASLTYTRKFTTWDAVVQGLDRVLRHLDEQGR